MTAQTKIDPRLELDGLYAARGEAEIVDVPDLAFLMIDGRGDPNTSKAYRDALEALFTVAYTAKFMVKREPDGINFKVMPLEGLWWSDDGSRADGGSKADWNWRMMIMQPQEVRPEIVAGALEGARARRALPALEEVRLEHFEEGPAAQVLYVGPYAGEGDAIAELHSFIEERGYTPRGRHHEIYLRDPRRTAPELLNTIIRQPIAAGP